MVRICCFSRAWWALMRRNVIYRRRNLVGTFLEVALPVAMMAILLVIKDKAGASLTSEHIPVVVPDNNNAYTPFSFQDYLTAARAKHVCEEQFNPFGQTKGFGLGITGQVWRGSNWMVPMVKCDVRKCKYAGQDASKFCEYSIVAVSGSNALGIERAKDFMQWLYDRYPELLTDMPFDFQPVQAFESSSHIDNYVKASDYGNSNKPKIWMGVVWEGNDPNNYNYQLRQNQTNFNSPSKEARPAVKTTPDTSKVYEFYSKGDFDTCAASEDIPEQGLLQNSCTGQYMYNGVLTMQRLVGDYILNKTGAASAGYSVAEGGVQFVQFPAPAYDNDGFFKALAGYGSLLAVIGLLYPTAIMISYVTREKELMQKELMKMMSVTEIDIGWSWFVTFASLHVLTTIFCTIVSMALFEGSQGIFLFLYWLFTFWSIINFCSAVASVTSKTTLAVLIGLLFFFVGVFLPIFYNCQQGDIALITLISIHPVAAFGFGMQEIGFLEDKGVGVTSATWNKSVHQSGYSFQTTLQCLILSALVWGLLSWYLNRVVKPAYGHALPPYFPFTVSYWFPGSADASIAVCDEDLNYNGDIPFEPVGENLKEQAAQGQSIEVRNLQKRFRDKIAVDGLSLSFYRGQVTALLGPNGAGKTTTINMLTGTISPTGGTAIVAGKNVKNQVHHIRQNMGICLQHDVLFPLLTTREHLQFFSRVKGLYAAQNYKEAEELVDQALRDVALMEKRDTLSKNLSGGMKRKLNVAIAFCGGSKVVMLDEPTSGMDPFSRRFTWNVIRQYRQDRCIILTTHFMDEADILGDRIAIMAEGQLRCCGSSLFLKKVYGVGYQLTVEKSPTIGNTVDLAAIVKGNVEEAHLLSSVGREVSYQLPMSATTQFLDMFDSLDKEVDEGAIASYGVSMTTLDEVFVLVARGHTPGEKQEYASSSRRITASQLPEAPMQPDHSDKSARSKMDLGKQGLFSAHLKALFKKRAAYFRRDKRAWCCTAILPSLFVLFGLIIYQVSSQKKDYKAVTLNLDAFNPELRGSAGIRNPVVFNQDSTNFRCQPGICSYQSPVIEINQTKELYYFCGYQGRLKDGSNCTIDESNNRIGWIGGSLASPVPIVTGSVLDSSEALFQTKKLYGATQFGAVFFSHENASLIALSGRSYANETEQQCLNFSGNYTSRSLCERLGGIGYVISYNYSAYHASPLFQGLADEALVRSYLNSDNFSSSATIFPLPTTKWEGTFGELEDSYSLWLLLVFSFPFIGGAYGSFVVAERESKAKHLQTVAGVKPTAYWLSTFLWDTLNYQIPCWITVALIYIFKVGVLTNTRRSVSSGVIVLLFLYGPAAASFSYAVSFAFTSPALCNLVVIVAGVILGMGGSLTVFMLNLSADYSDPPKENLKVVATVLTWILRLFPAFNFANGTFRVAAIEFYEYRAGRELNAWSDQILLVEVIFLLAESVVYLFLAIQLDIWNSNPRVLSLWRAFLNMLTCRCLKPKPVHKGIKATLPDDDDVLTEQNRVLSGQANDDLIVMSQLTKVFENGKLAVDNMSLGIPRGECFGLLGINGAGKTTAMGLLTAEFPPSKGDATLAGYSVTLEPEKTRRRIGYCPQFDAHFANLTGREHVELYAAIKGVPQKFVKEASLTTLDQVGLKADDIDRLAAGYSGGMKRRLSLACAMIGKPEIMFLDEATTGVDPVSRREIWRVISDMVGDDDTPEDQRVSIMLTTHSMEESEALCPRIGIMANGRLRCLGSAQHLKNKFGRGYQVELKVKLVDQCDEDYSRISSALVNFKQGRRLESDPHRDEEAGAVEGVDFGSLPFDLEEVKEAIRMLTSDDDYLVNMVTEHDHNGYHIWRNASAGMLLLEELAFFCALELRILAVDQAIHEHYPMCVLRERQDNKLRYEVPSENVRISAVFKGIEARKSELQLDDYGISQTSLEQVFNMHAAEAEKLKLGQNDG